MTKTLEVGQTYNSKNGFDKFSIRKRFGDYFVATWGTSAIEYLFDKDGNYLSSEGQNMNTRQSIAVHYQLVIPEPKKIEWRYVTSDFGISGTNTNKPNNSIASTEKALVRINGGTIQFMNMNEVRNLFDN